MAIVWVVLIFKFLHQSHSNLYPIGIIKNPEVMKKASKKCTKRIKSAINFISPFINTEYKKNGRIFLSITDNQI
tara:strand:+ start:325 stop:546 length:222 start_codon:yes stop_codon:yes gene_type:complete